MNNRNNLAYDYSYTTAYPSYMPQKQSNVRIKVSTKKQKVAQKRANALGLLKIFLVVSLAFVVLYRGVVITDKAATVDAKRSELEALITSNEKLQFEIDRALDLDTVEDIARNQLGMRRAEKYQTIYINLEQTDYVEKVAEKEFSPASQVAELVTNLRAYID